MRRVLLGVVAGLAAVLLLPTAAVADAVVTFESPQPDQLVDTPIVLTLRAERRIIDPHPSEVTLRLSVDGRSPHEASEAVALDCVENCSGDASSTTSRWSGPELRPATLAPFGDVPICNGRWWLVASATPGETFRSDPSQGSFLVSRPSAGAGDLAVTVESKAVELTWGPAPETDVVGYLVERRADGADTWQRLASLEAAARSFRDEPGAGRYEYRLAVVRPDGRVDGEPAAACSDEQADLVTWSAPWSVALTTTGGSASPAGSPGTDPDEPGDGSAAEGSTSDGGSTEGGDGEGSEGGGRGAVTSPRDRIAASRSSGGIEAPSVGDGRAADRREHYFGEDGPFSDRLDYAGVEALAGEEDPYAMESVPGGVIEIFDRELDLEHVLRPVATGMVLVAFGLHLRRWVRATG